MVRMAGWVTAGFTGDALLYEDDRCSCCFYNRREVGALQVGLQGSLGACCWRRGPLVGMILPLALLVWQRKGNESEHRASRDLVARFNLARIL